MLLTIRTRTVLRESSVETNHFSFGYMKRFACHYLYVSSDGCYSKYVVELEDTGRVRRYFPLKEELSSTQWVGGIIILSPLYDLEIYPEEKYSDFLKRITVETETDVPVYAWYIANSDLQQREFTTASKPVRL